MEIAQFKADLMSELAGPELQINQEQQFAPVIKHLKKAPTFFLVLIRAVLRLKQKRLRSTSRENQKNLTNIAMEYGLQAV